MASRRRRRSCKYGKLKRKTKGRRCRKSRRRSRKSVCIASIPSSITNYQNKLIDLTRAKVSLTKRIVRANAAVSSATDPVKKLQKELIVAKLKDERSKFHTVYSKTMAKLIDRLDKFAAKNKVSAALAADERARFGPILSKIELGSYS